jgi:hypothetical protein
MSHKQLSVYTGVGPPPSGTLGYRNQEQLTTCSGTHDHGGDTLLSAMCVCKGSTASYSGSTAFIRFC